MLAIIDAYKNKAFSKNNIINNIFSGIVVGIVALPLAMAFAIASGVAPAQGLYTAFIAGAIVSIFGGTNVQIAGPTGAFIVVLSGITAKYGFAGLQIATIMAGLILILLGLTKMGGVIKYIPDPVIIGFTSGIAVIIFIGQWPNFFGLKEVSGEHFIDKLSCILQKLPHLNLSTTLIGLMALMILVITPKVKWIKKIPAPLIALLTTTSLHMIFRFKGIETIGSAFDGGIPGGLPDLNIPEITVVKITELIGPAFTIAMLGSIESLLSAVVADGMTGTKHNSNQELVGQGIANIVSPLFGGIAATGAIARTATNIKNGGNSPLAGIVHSITLVMILMFLAPLAKDIPLATLAAILFIVSWNMSEAKHFFKILKGAPKADIVILLVTFSLTVFADLVIAVNIGVILATLHFMRRMASSVEIKQESRTDIIFNNHETDIPLNPDNIMIFTIDGPFFFGVAEKFEEALSMSNTEIKNLIIRLEEVPFIDVTGLITLEEVIHKLKSYGTNVIISGANSKVRHKMERAGIIESVGKSNFCNNLSDALKKVHHKVKINLG
ncbi:MAG: STAS domain-containing protein [Gammaproteobacteria bacterium]|nr:MAG: STAS domain-containing protein [Gammaproteobacteria bacterium]